MDLRTLLTAAAALLIPWGVLAANDSPSTPPEEPRPESTQAVSPDPYADLNKRVQEKLHQLGFYDGPVNGDFGPNTQAALAQFQLSVPLPASGQLDSETLAALDVQADPAPPAATSGDSSAGASASGTVEASAK